MLNRRVRPSCHCASTQQIQLFQLFQLRRRTIPFRSVSDLYGLYSCPFSTYQLCAVQSTLNDSLDRAENVESEYSLAKGPSRNLPTLPSTVLHLPPLLLYGSRYSNEGYHQYWPFVDNVLVHNQTRPTTQKDIQRSYWYCRLWRNETDEKSEGAGIRAKQMHVTLACGMKMIMAKQFDTTNKLILSLHKDKKSGCFIHNHSFDYSDSIKLKSAVRSTATRSNVIHRYSEHPLIQN